MELIKLSDNVELSAVYVENRDTFIINLDEWTIGVVYEDHHVGSPMKWVYEHRESGITEGAVSFENAVEALYLTEVNCV